MQKLLIALLLSVQLFAVTSCVKQNIEPMASYYPMGTGSSWTYRDHVINKIFTVEQLGQDTTIHGKAYTINTNTIGGNFYKRTDANGNGWRFDILAYTPLGAATSEQLVYKKDAQVGETWEVTFNSPSAFFANDTAFVKIVSKRMENSRSKIINGVVFTDLYNTFSELYIAYRAAPTQFRKIGTADYYFAQNIGLVHYKVNFLAPVSANFPNRDVDILSYSIKP